MSPPKASCPSSLIPQGFVPTSVEGPESLRGGCHHPLGLLVCPAVLLGALTCWGREGAHLVPGAESPERDLEDKETAFSNNCGD